MKLFAAHYLSFLASALAAPSPTATSSAPAPAFTYNATHFLFHDAPFQIIGGQMDPQRIPPPYWRSRLRLARAMGLNTIFSYVFWNLLEPTPGGWENSDQNDIAAFFRIAHEEGLQVVLRPGPYICGEREWGGFPAWLASVEGLTVRANNGPFLEKARRYLGRLAGDLRASLVHNGGNVLMVQVENEYGSYGEDHVYMGMIKEMLEESFGGIVLYTNDGTEKWTLEGGSVSDVLAEVDGDPRAGFAALRKYITDPSMQGPLLDGEYYTWTFDSWGYSRSIPNIQGFVDDVHYVLGNESASISLYMVHGGTNFGFSNGALWQDKTRAFTSSYDYGAPIDEAGRTTELFWRLREAIQKYVPDGSIPEVPTDIPLQVISAFDLVPNTALFDTLSGPKISNLTPLTMESLNQSYGFTLYTHTSTTITNGTLVAGDRPRDRIIVYLDGKFHSVIDSTYKHPQNVSIVLKPGTKLELLIENLGRVGYYSRGTQLANHVIDPHKGIVGDIKVGGTVLEGWEMAPIELDELPALKSSSSSDRINTTQPVFFTGSFNFGGYEMDTAALDTYLHIEGGIKGNVWVNGFHLGRYWRIGPQQSLYLPGTVVRRGFNEVVVLELEPGRMDGGILKGVGVNEREWKVEEDVDCVGCLIT